jgi:hypothetical protein
MDSKRNDPMRPGPGRGPARMLLAVGVVAALVTGACTGDGGSSPVSNGRRSSASPLPVTIPQPVVEGLEVAPDGQRVDLTMPSFSNPTRITNPLFPISMQGSVLLLGRVDGKAFRTEVTLLPDTRIIEWQDQRVETLVSQYVAFLGGRLHEVAYDFYAQADDGSVWYFGEDVFNFEDGSIVDTHGTWIAGKDGPAAMIMPARPQVGDVYRPENIPGFVFEEVTVTSVDQPLDGPLAPIDGGLVIEELHMDGSTEDKSFAPGYGEFSTAGGGDTEAVALAVPTDALSTPPPAELVTLETAAAGVVEAAGSGDWSAARDAVDEMTLAWDRHRAGEVPKMIEPRMTDALDSLADAVRSRNAARSTQAAIDAARWSLDLQLRHRPAVEIDFARLGLWADQLVRDAAAGDAAAVGGDFFAMDYIRDRILHALDGAEATRFNTILEELQGAVGDEDLPAAAGSAAQLRDFIAGVHLAS